MKGASLVVLLVALATARAWLDLTLHSDTPYTTQYYDQTIDHFNQAYYGDATFKEKVLVNTNYLVKGAKNAPIFFYSGNEGEIEEFYSASGYIMELAQTHNALVIFAEHRFYGSSLPFGQQSFSWPHIGLLTTEQACADYATMLADFRRSNADFTDSAIITFGGSYGGMLSAYLRFKYPDVFAGALAASAPVRLSDSKEARSSFWSIVTKDYYDVSPQAVTNIQTAFAQLNALAAEGQSGYDQITQQFNLCSPMKSNADYIQFLYMVRNAFVTCSMFDYPYSANFGIQLPAWPVNYTADLMLSAATPLQGLYEVTALSYNGTDGDLTCLDEWTLYIACADPTGCGLGDDAVAWNFQACYEIQLAYGTNNKTDMFPVLPWTDAMKASYCQATFNTTGRFQWFADNFWGSDVWSASNIIWSNGLLDPWHLGGIMSSDVSSLPAIHLDLGAHHLDLRASNPADPPQVTAARAQEATYIDQFLQDAQKKRGHKKHHNHI